MSISARLEGAVHWIGMKRHSKKYLTAAQMDVLYTSRAYSFGWTGEVEEKNAHPI